MKHKKPHIKRHGHEDWRVYYDGWQVFRFLSSTSCFGLIQLEKILSDEGFDMQRLVDSGRIDVYSLWCLPLRYARWKITLGKDEPKITLDKYEPEVFLLLEQLRRLRTSGVIK
jgi:hypothetical protein